MYSLKIVKDAKNLIDINLLTKIQHFNDVNNFAIVSCNIHLFICDKYGAIFSIKFYSKAKIRQTKKLRVHKDLKVLKM